MKDKSYADKASQILYAVDLGSSHLTMMAGEMVDGYLHILGVERELCRGLAKKGILDNPTEVASRLVRMSKQLKNKLSLPEDPRNIFVSLGGRDLHVVESEVERSLAPINRVSDKDMHDMERECKDKFEGAYPTLSVAEVLWSSFLLDGKREVYDPVGERAKMLKGNYEVYYGPRAMRNKWEECIEKQDRLNVVSYFVNTEAWRTALLNSDDEQEGCAIINFGAETTTFCAYYHGRLIELIVVEYGSHNITKDIAYDAICIADAEKLKKKVTTLAEPTEKRTFRVDSAVEQGGDVFFNTDTLHLIAVARVEETLDKILACIEQNRDILEEKNLYITGGGANQKGLITFLRERIPMNVQMGRTIDFLSEDTPEEYCYPEYSQLIGTLLLAADYCQNNEIVSQQQTKQKGKAKEERQSKSFIQRALGLFDDNADLSRNR